MAFKRAGIYPHDSVTIRVIENCIRYTKYKCQGLFSPRWQRSEEKGKEGEKLRR
jgi:hypothetical protein